MNINHVKAVFTNGVNLWLADKKSIVLRLLVWPNLVPLFLVSLVVVTSMSLSSRVNNANGGMSVDGGITYGISSDIPVGDLQSVLGASLGYKYVATPTSSSIEEMVTSNQVTFALEIIEDQSRAEFDIFIRYDLQRDYPHMKWIDRVKDKLPGIALEIRKSRLMNHGLPEEVLDKALKPVNIKVEGYGVEKGYALTAILSYILWGVVILLAIETASFVCGSQMTSDIEHDFMSIWKAANVDSQSVLLGRLLSALFVYMAALLAFVFSLSLWGTLYSKFVEFIAPRLTPEQLSNQSLYNFTVGFNEVFSRIEISQFIMVLFVLASVALLMLSIRMRLSLYVNNLEQVNTKMKGIDLVIGLVPICGFVIGFIPADSQLMFVPVFNAYIALLNVFVGSLTIQATFIGIITNVIFASIILLLVSRKMVDTKRVCLN